MAATPMPFVKARFFDRCGKPLSGGKVYTYEPRSTTPKVTYTSGNGDTPNTNPITLDAAGQANIYLRGRYRFITQDSKGVVVEDGEDIGSWYSDSLDDQLQSINEYLLSASAQVIDTVLSAVATENGWIDALVVTEDGRTQRSKNKDSVNVRDFGAVGDGTLHTVQEWYTSGSPQYRGFANLAAVQVKYPHVIASTDSIDWAAIVAAIASTATDNTVRCNAGKYMVNKPITNNRDNIKIIGEGPYVTHIITTSATADILANTGNKFECSGIGFTTTSVKTDGVFVKLHGANNVLDNFYMNFDFYGISSIGPGNRITNGFMEQGQGGGVRIDVNGGDTTQIIDNVLVGSQPAPYPACGIRVQNNIALTLSNVSVIRQGVNLLIAPRDGEVVSNLMVINCFFDTCVTPLSIKPVASGIAIQLQFINVWFGSGSSGGIKINNQDGGTIDGISFYNPQVLHNTGDGIQLAGTAKNISLIGGLIANNSGSGLGIGDSVDNITITGTTIGKGGLQAGNLFGLYLNSTPNNLSIVNTYLTGNTNGAIIGNVSGVVISGCQGFKTTSSGSAEIAAAQTALVVNHGLAAIPKGSDILISQTNDWSGFDVYLDTTTINATSFTLRKTNTLAAANFSWRAACNGN